MKKPSGRKQLPFLAMIRRDWKNLPNLLTATRMVGALALPALITHRSTKKKVAGLVLFTTLVTTDHLDGWLAKKVYGSTDLGKMLDPIADKEIILITLASALADARRQKDRQLTKVLLAALAVIGTREVTVACVKLRAQHETGAIDSAIQSSRVSMIVEASALGALLVPLNTPLVRKGKVAMLVISAAASVYSGWDYYRKYRSLSS